MPQGRKRKKNPAACPSIISETQSIEDVDPALRKEMEEVERCCDTIITSIGYPEFDIAENDVEALTLIINLACRNPSPTAEKEHNEVMIDEILGNGLKQVDSVLVDSITMFGHKVDNADQIKADQEQMVAQKAGKMELLEPLIENQCKHIQETENIKSDIQDGIRKIKQQLQDDAKAFAANERAMEQCIKATASLQKLMRVLEPNIPAEEQLYSKDIKQNIMTIEKVLVSMECEHVLLAALMVAFTEPRYDPDYFGRDVALKAKSRLEKHEKKLTELAESHREKKPIAEAELQKEEEKLAEVGQLLGKAEDKLAALENELGIHKEEFSSSRDAIKNHSKNVAEWKRIHNSKTKSLNTYRKQVMSSFEFVKNRVLPPPAATADKENVEMKPESSVEVESKG